MNAENQIRQLGQIVAKALQHDAFKKKLLADPSAVLKEYGMVVPSGIELRVVENTDRVLHLTLPAKSTTDELSDVELESVSGGIIAILIGLLREPRTIGQPKPNL